jgi:acyl-CoA synthetase (AMP-forming)/AMP-acid ligase II
MTTWTSNDGVVLRDLVPAALRRRWVEEGHCPDRDVYTLFRAHACAHPERAAVTDADGITTYGRLDESARGIAGALADAGLGARDIIGIQVPNGWRAVAAELAVAAVGAVALPFPAGRGRRDAVSLLGRSRASAAIVADAAGDVRLAENLASVRTDLPALREILVFGHVPPGCRPLDRLDVDAATGVRGLNAMPGRSWPRISVDPDAPARILVSSGSEAEPKMVAYSHNAMMGGRANYVAALHDSPQPMSSLVLVPLASSYGSLGIVTVAAHGGTIHVLHRFAPEAAIRAITDRRPTLVFGVPTMLRRMAAEPRQPAEDMSCLRAVVSSAAPLPVGTITACRARFGCPVLNVYGSADGVNCHTDRADLPGAHAGRPDEAVAVLRIVDESGRPLPAGQEGEIWALGPMTPLCYVNAPDLDARYRAPGGWVRTGDRGVIDEDRRLRVVDRMKQIVIRGGYNISPAEVEAQLAAHPAIVEAACVAVPDADLGERLCACVVQRPGTRPLTLREVTDFLETERGLERRKLPEHLIRLAELPLMATGKVCRSTVKQLAMQQL